MQASEGRKKAPGKNPGALAPQVRLELTTLRLTAECSAIELLRNNADRIHASFMHSVCFLVSRRRLIFPGAGAPSIVSAEELNCCVRYGYRWILFAITTGNFKACSLKTSHCASLCLKNAPCTFSCTHFIALLLRLHLFFKVLRDQALDRLVLASCMLPCFHRQPIYHVVFMGSYSLSGWHTSS